MRAVALVLVLIATAMAATGENYNDGCLQECGNITIPYPFGTTDDCRLNRTFSITCNTTFNPPKPFLGESNLEVIDISLNGEINVLNLIAYNCSYADGRTGGRNTITLGTGNFTISPTKNKFMAMGCHSDATFQPSLNNNDDSTNNWFETGCTAYCLSDAKVEDSCSGIGCCQTTIPRRLSFAVVRLVHHLNVSDFSRCSYAFVAHNEFNFKKEYIREFTQETVPVVWDWAVGNQTCEVAALDQASFLCKAHATCFQRSQEGIPGYLCKCKDGYQGNPYLEHPNQGCKDIDECSDPSLNDCTSICINTPGSYTCGCPKGYRGDGKQNGSGCIKRISVVIAIAAGSCAAFGLLFLLLGTWWFAKLLRRRRDSKQRQEFFKRNGGLLLQQKLISKEGSFEKTKIFTTAELEVATDNFNENRIVGHGGQGTVYKGMLEDGRIVAVKKSKLFNKEQLEQFVNEFVILSQIDHRNVVKLLGCCLETEIPLLVYEFVPGGTLFQLLHDKTEEFPPSWEMRLRMATEVASAIAYLHTYASTPVFHRDIKTSNILLDEKLRAKLCDFGISKSLDIDQTHFTTQVKGTFGYCDPEYFRSNRFTEKSDVYSFGVVLAELVTGKKPILTFGLLEEEEPKGLVGHFISSMEEDRLFEIVDERVVTEGNDWQVMVVAKLVRRCLNLERRNRPSMKEIARELDGIRSGMKKHEEGKGLLLLNAPNESIELDLGLEPNMCCSDSTTSSFISISGETELFSSL